MVNKDISNIEDIKLLVNTFYGKVQKDEFIGVIFNEKIGDRWPEHLEKMYRFWQTILLEEHTYSGSLFPLLSGLGQTRSENTYPDLPL